MILSRDDVKTLLGHLNSHMNMALEAAAGFSVSRTHYEVYPDHFIIKLMEAGNGDIPLILDHFNIEHDKLWDMLNRKLDRFESGNTGRPRFSRDLLELLEASWLSASIHYGKNRIRSGMMFGPFLEDSRFSRTLFGEAISDIEPRKLRNEFFDIVSTSAENMIEPADRRERIMEVPSAKKGETALDLYMVDVTGRARDGEIDPVSGRDEEIRQVIDILSRRRKNNPILVGEAGVGKTAIVEGLALRLVAGDVPDSLKDTEIRSLDLGLLQAGAGVKGEFENRLKSVIKQIVDSENRIIMFIDEAHTLIGAGGQAGMGDAANLLKPALARGTLRTIGATTWTEYKKYIEKDPALERRFQMVKVDEPDAETASIMLRGIRTIYEKHHGITITDAAVTAAANLSHRYIAGRQLPDKAVDVLDTASARVKMTAAGKPKRLDLLERQRTYIQGKLDSLHRDVADGYADNKIEIEDADRELKRIEEQIFELEGNWTRQSEIADKIVELQAKLRKLGGRSEETVADEVDTEKATEKKVDEPDGDNEPSVEEDASLDRDQIVKKLTALRDQLRQIQEDEPLVLVDVDESVVASVIADWTGIPVGRMVRDQASALLEFENIVGKHIIGQDHALSEIADTIRVTKSGMGKQDNPIGVFLFVGPSGVGKSETAKWTAEVLFGGEKFMTVINMSEYQEKHTVSQLKGSPPGYVGYGEGGILTEAVRRRPYSVVLLDEVEKADREVMNLFYQVFDKGFMRDGEGREINVKNTVLMMTSNLASDVMTQACQGEQYPDPDQMIELIRPELTRYFQAALLARMKIIPFFPLDKDAMGKIVGLKLNALAERMQNAHRISVEYGDDVLEAIAERCTVGETGARYVDYIIERTLLPEISRSLVQKMSEDAVPGKLVLLKTDEDIISFEFR